MDFEFRVFQRHDVRDGSIEHFPVVADHQDGIGIFAQKGFEPCGALKVEIIGRLVEHQQVWHRKQHPGQRRPHPPTAREGTRRVHQLFLLKAKTDEDFTGAGFCRISVYVGQTGMDFADAIGVRRGFGLRHQAGAFNVCSQYDFQHRVGRGGDFLGNKTHARAAFETNTAIPFQRLILNEPQ